MVLLALISFGFKVFAQGLTLSNTDLHLSLFRGFFLLLPQLSG